MNNLELTPSRIVLVYLFLFLFGDILGYFLEVIFRRVFSAKKWVNPGFMKGPWLPLYGFGLIIMFTLVNAIKLIPLPFYNIDKNIPPNVYDLIPLIIIGSSLVLLEFLAGIIFVKGFRVKLWDYSNMRGNILGIICPVFSVIWFAIGIIFYYAVYPYVALLFNKAFAYMFGTNLSSPHFGFIFILGLCYGIMLIDFSTSINLFAKIVSLAKERNLVLRYENVRNKQKGLIKNARLNFFKTYNLKDNLSNNDKIIKATEKTNAFINKVKSIILINPNKKTKNNYSKDGRPMKEDDNVSRKDN